MVSESLVPSVGNILFDGVAHCDFSAESGRLLLAAAAFYTKPGKQCFFALSDGRDVNHFLMVLLCFI